MTAIARTTGRSRLGRFWMVALAGALLLSACGGSSALDDLKSPMTDVFKTELDVDLEDIQCPEGVSIEAGNQFQCTAAITDGAGRLRVGVLMDVDGRANFTRENVLVDLDAIEQEIGDELSRGIGAPIVLECGEASVQVAEPEGTIPCTAVANNGETRGVEVTVEDIDATTTWRLLAV